MFLINLTLNKLNGHLYAFGFILFQNINNIINLNTQYLPNWDIKNYEPPLAIGSNERITHSNVNV